MPASLIHLSKTIGIFGTDYIQLECLCTGHICQRKCSEQTITVVNHAVPLQSWSCKCTIYPYEQEEIDKIMGTVPGLFNNGRTGSLAPECPLYIDNSDDEEFTSVW